MTSDPRSQREKSSTRETMAKEDASGAKIGAWSCASRPAWARGGAEIDKLASARSPSAAPAAATRAARIGRIERNVNTVLIHQTSNFFEHTPGSVLRSDGAHSPTPGELVH
jgi:hypothetical protein